MAKSVSEHMENCKSVVSVIEDANALLKKTQAELTRSREVFEMLLPFQHPKLVVSDYNVNRLTGREKVTPEELIRAEVARINELLGDRA